MTQNSHLTDEETEAQRHHRRAAELGCEPLVLPQSPGPRPGRGLRSPSPSASCLSAPLGVAAPCSPGRALPPPRAFSHTRLLSLALSNPSLSLTGPSIYGAPIPRSRKSLSLHSETSSYQPFPVDICLLANPASIPLSGDRAQFSLGTPRPQPASQALSLASVSPANHSLQVWWLKIDS